MGIRRALIGILFAVAMAPTANMVSAQPYDVLDLPAVPSELAARSLIFAVREFNGKYYATGHRGHILYSDDGVNWTQAEVPVRSSLLDIYFVTPELGWAVGHEGVILHSSDAGKTWVKQYDGERYGEEGLAYYKQLTADNPDNELYPFMVDEMQFAIEQGADKPLFKVEFHSPTYGHVLGAYGMILKTEDGGKSWVHVLETTENDSFYHVYDVANLSGKNRFFMSGEAGLFMIGDADTEVATLVETVPWQGSFFTTAATPGGAIVLGGLRGRMFRTENEGQTWDEVPKRPTSSMVDSVVLDDGRIVFVGIAGEILISDDDGRTFSLVPLTTGNRIYAVEEGPSGSLLLGGPAGIEKLKLPQ
ncbi:WD40/YVTN/BNR-like repeat-containing protein [Pseudohalioglobus lutimaris]|uniref:Glycosyl hydrolase n=1 Tax=Pseudohalioglobus lutimaris TaxID=1737061 RepID=A0A2N5X2S0_9GAMM|nr:YCF48-related protein [Pseudohalioglobus lutimaris]PLW68782.1 glycosyl hydrolase [Pseudohalioglobus lutimaris]